LGRMRVRTLTILMTLVLVPGYVAAQTSISRTARDNLQFEVGQPRKVPPFPLVLNATVRSYVDSYLAHSDALRLSYARSAPYLTQMTEVLRQYGVPSDLVYLAFAESSFIKSGSGPWQLTKATARRYGLQVDDYVDERRDPIKSTHAAAEYLATLHEDVGDWRLAIVAWNTGEGMMQKFVLNQGEDYDRMLDRLPGRTRGLLNRFMAVAFISKNAKEYGIDDVVYSEPPQYVRISVPGGTPLDRVASATHSEVYEIKHLNPALLTERIPPNGYDVAIPLGSKRDAHIDWNDADTASARDSSVTREDPVVAIDDSAVASDDPVVAKSGRHHHHHHHHR
jgi:membrane-bound lytic murein transglycosylase D